MRLMSLTSNGSLTSDGDGTVVYVHISVCAGPDADQGYPICKFRC